jgi:hypothetical protein
MARMFPLSHAVLLNQSVEADTLAQTSLDPLCRAHAFHCHLFINHSDSFWIGSIHSSAASREKECLMPRPVRVLAIAASYQLFFCKRRRLRLLSLRTVC